MRMLTENDYRVLSKVFDNKINKGFSRALGSTVEDIKNKLDLSDSKVRSAIRVLVEYGYIDKGIKKGKKDTFYITALGLEDLKDISQQSINIVREANVNE